MSHAQKVACDILNMSRSDFEDLMAPVDASKRKTEEKEQEPESMVATHQDETWKTRIEKIATENVGDDLNVVCRELNDSVVQTAHNRHVVGLLRALLVGIFPAKLLCLK